MLVLHVHVKGRSGTIERTYDFLRNDGKDELEGVDLIIPYEDSNPHPMHETDCVAWLRTRDMRGDH